MVKKLIIATIICLMLGILAGGTAAVLRGGGPEAFLGASGPDKAEGDFSGNRRVVFTADRSDLENFIDGGRSSLELLLRRSRPDWLSYDLSADGRQADLEFSFSFGSRAEYEERFEELAGMPPTLFVSGEEEELLLEGCPAQQMLNFLQAQMELAGCLDERELWELFTVKENEMEREGRRLQSDSSCLAVYPKSERPVALKGLELFTEGMEDGTFHREIKARVEAGENQESRVRKLSRFFEAAGKPKSQEGADGSWEVEVEFDAENQNQLSEKTMACLHVPASIAESQRWVEGNTVEVRRREWIDWKALLGQEGGFRYAYQYPSDYREVTAVKEETQVENGLIAAADVTQIDCSYERNFNFSLVEVETDLSGIWGIITRTIRLKIPAQVVLEGDLDIRRELEKRLRPGTVMDIYDEGGMRCYELSFSSGRTKDVDGFTSEILGDSCGFDCRRTRWPWQKTSIEERVPGSGILEEDCAPGQVRYEYRLPGNRTCSFESKDPIRLEFSGLNAVWTAVLVMLLAAGAAAVRGIFKRIFKRPR